MRTNIINIVEVNIKIIISYHNFFNFIINYESFLYISKFQILLYYFFNIYEIVFTNFYLYINRKLKVEKSIIKVSF